MARKGRGVSARSQSASVAVREMRRLADPRRAESLQWFFKTAPGEYGAGDRFLGLTMPRLRALAAQFRELPLAEVETLLESPWHEVRLLAVVVLGNAYRQADEKARAAIYRLYLRRSDRVNNWDLVDVSAPRIVGEHLLKRSRAPLRRLARSRSLWERRIAIVATYAFIRRGELEDTLRIAEQLLYDRQDLIHKAVGWMLREVGKRDERVLLSFLDRNAARMPRTALRYSIERLSVARRKRYLAIPKRSGRR